MEAFASWLDQAAKNVASEHDVSDLSAGARLGQRSGRLRSSTFRSSGEAAKATGVTTRSLVSGAGHDAAWIARVAPAAMIFVPSRDGRSHAADEWTENDAIARGAAVLFEAVIALDAMPEVET